MINRLTRGYVHIGTVVRQKKQFSVVRGTNYKGVKWFIYAAMQIKKNTPCSLRKGLHICPHKHFILKCKRCSSNMIHSTEAIIKSYKCEENITLQAERILFFLNMLTSNKSRAANRAERESVLNIPRGRPKWGGLYPSISYRDGEIECFANYSRGL